MKTDTPMAFRRVLARIVPASHREPVLGECLKFWISM
jgi:hypothetical protein